MDEHGLPIVGAGVDYTKVPALDHKNTLVFLNKFIVHTSQFLNRFSLVCEEKLSDLSLRIQKVDISLNILEAKLASIPGLEGVQATSQYEPPAAIAGTSNASPAVATAPAAPAVAAPPPPPGAQAVEEPKKSVMKIRDHPDYKEFFKLKRLGVNYLQIQMKMKAKGLNPDLLEDEDADAPPVNGAAAYNTTGTSQVEETDGDTSSAASNASDDSFESK
ncbi:hypothetical protein EMCRGX_G020080 [Ephydatia muelleri]|eukprot:Em0016g20a